MTRADRFEGAVLVAIVVLVGGAAGFASFSHVHDWTMTNSPAGTSTWFGWINACISELVPVGALLELRRRRRRDPEAKVGYPLALLVAAAGLSLAAQLAVAKPGPSGWLLSAVPAVAFMALVKLVLAGKPTTPDEVLQTVVATPPAVAQPAPATVLQTVVATPPAPIAEPVQVVEPEPTPEPARVLLPIGFAQPHPAPRPQPAVDADAATVETPGLAEAARAATPPAHRPPAQPSKPPADNRPPARPRPATGSRPLAETRRLVDAVLADEPGLSQQKIADRIGVPRRTVRDALALSQA